MCIKKGRNPDLIEQRNYKLAARYYWYSVILGLNIDRCLVNLRQDFDLTISTLYDLINENNGIINILTQEDIDVPQLKRWFPHFSWVYNFSSSSSPSFEQWFLSRHESADPVSPAN